MRTPGKFLPGAMAVIMGLAIPARAADHLVPLRAVGERLAEHEAARRNHLAALDSELSSPEVATAASRVGVDLARVRGALRHLDDEELGELAARAKALRTDPAASGLSRGQIWLIVVGGVLLIVLLSVLLALASDPYYSY